MKYLSRVAFMVLSLLLCTVAQATNLDIKIQSTYASEWSGYLNNTYDIRFTDRIFTANAWDGICLPFDMNETQLINTFGENGYEIRAFKEMNGNNFVFESASTITHGVPYLIKIKNGIAADGTVRFIGVTIASSFTDDYIVVEPTSGLQFRGFYFRKYSYQMYDSNNSHTFYTINAEGTLSKAIWLNEPGYIGPYAYFYVNDASAVTSIGVEGIVASGGGGGDDPNPTTLEGKIAARLQITDAPTIYIDLPEIGNQTLGEYLYKKLGNNTTAEEAPYRPAKIQVVATDDTSSPHYLESFIEDAYENGKANLEIKVRGNSTALASIPTGKRPYRLKFANKKNSVDGKAHKHDLLGYGYAKRNWVLLVNLNDNSLLRNALTYHIGKAVGLPFCPGYKFVDLVINNEYRGSYQITDQCEVDANRININEDTGWYVEFQGRPDMCDYPMCFTESGILMNINNPEPVDETDEEQRNAIINPIKDWFLNSWKKAFGVGYTNPETGWRAYNDEETLIKFWIATELTGDYDGLMSVKAYREADGKLCWGPLWDKDLAFGNYNSMADPKGKLVANLQQASCIQPLFEKLTTDPQLMLRVKETMDNLVESGIKATLLSKIDEMAAAIAQSAAQNFERWGNPQQPGGFGNVGSLANHQAYVDQLKDWFSDRVDYVQEQFTILAAAANTSVGSLTIDAKKNQEGNGITTDVTDKVYDVSLANKTYEKNKWNTISVPFSVDEATLKTVFGDNYELKEYAGIYTDGTTMYFATPADNAIIAGFPYLIKPSKDVDASPLFNSVALSYCSNWDNNHKAYGESITYGNYSFCASLYHNGTLYPGGTDILIGGDAASFTIPTRVNAYDQYATIDGINAYIRIANGLSNPTISFVPEGTVERAQMNDVPTIFIDSDAAIDPDEWCTAAIEVFDENNMIGSNFTLDNTGLEVKYVGDGSDIKTSYRLKFAKKRAFLGSKSGSFKQWVLESNDDDPSMLRNGLTEELGDQIGFGFTPGCQYVDLVVNGTYRGTYQITDRVKVESGRILVSNKDTDWLMEIAEDDEVNSTDLYVAGDNSSPNIVIKNPDKDDLSADDKAALQTAVGNFFTTFWADVENNVDQTSFINWYIASEILGGYKQLSDIYVYKDNADGKLYFGPLWSNDKAYGNNPEHPVDMTDLNTEGSYNGMIFKHAKYQVMASKIEALWQEQWFKDAVIAKWNTIYGDNKTIDLQALLNTKVDALAEEIAQTQADNYAPTANGGAGWPLDGEYDAAVQSIKDYLTERFIYLDTKFKELSANETVETVELIEGQPYTNTEEKTVENLTYTRTFKDTQIGKYQAWYVPFNYTITEEDTENFNFYKIHLISASASSTGGVVDDNTKIYIHLERMTKNDVLVGNRPYVFVPLKIMTNHSFMAGNTTLYAINPTSRLHMSTAEHQYNFYGTYDHFTYANAREIFYLNGGALHPNKKDASMIPYRWYIKPEANGSNDGYAKPTFVFVEDDTPTEISMPNTDDINRINGYYSINGIRLERPMKGLNIIRMKDGNTRKVIIR